MGRYARLSVTDIPYHIINRGNNHQNIFFSEDDYWFFLEALELAKQKYQCKIYSFVLMTNHVHLLIEAKGDNRNLAYFIKHVSQRHGQYINRRYNRSGTLWEGRFKSSPVSTDRYLLACSRYIEMNPVRAGMVKDPTEYYFSSYGAKIGLKELKWLDFDPLYLGLGKSVAERQIEYKKWFSASNFEDEWNQIRKSVQRNWAYGNDFFKQEMENISGRRFEIKKVGRKSKSEPVPNLSNLRG